MTELQIKTLEEKLWVDGFVKISNIFSQSQVGLIRDSIKNLMNFKIEPWQNRDLYPSDHYLLPTFSNSDWDVLSNILGRDPILDQELDVFFQHQIVSALLNKVIGPDYLIWELSARTSNSTDKGLSLHQDAKGELGISILLDDQLHKSGTTALIKGSHRFPVGCRESGIEQYLSPKLMAPFVTPVTGNAGDVYIFFKKTWHGRIKKNKAFPPTTALIFSLFPSSYDFQRFNIPENILTPIPSFTKGHLVCTSSLNSFEKKLDCLMDKLYDRQFYINSFFWKTTPLFKHFLDKIKSYIKN
jgi:putative 2OG-Fe(II) oxygenase